MSVDINKLSFSSAYPTDKVVAMGTIANGKAITVVNDGATSNDPQVAKIVTGVALNPYGKACFIRGRWSIDGGSTWQTLDSRIIYTFTITDPSPATTTVSGLKAAISMGVSDATVYARTANGLHGNVTDTGVAYVYTPISQTFIVEWVLFELD